MQNVIAFRRHARASTRSESFGMRAAKITIRSAVKPSRRAVAVANTDDHQSSGIRSLCHHLDTCAGVQPSPISAAIASRDGQNSIIKRNEVNSVMENTLRHSVLKCKSNLSHDLSNTLGQNVLMDKGETASSYKAGYIGRTRAARAIRFKTQQELCLVLGIEQPTYSKYETRTFLPKWLTERFCAACGVSDIWLASGKGPGVPWEPYYPPKKPRRKRMRRAA